MPALNRSRPRMSIAVRGLRPISFTPSISIAAAAAIEAITFLCIFTVGLSALEFIRIVILLSWDCF